MRAPRMRDETFCRVLGKRALLDMTGGLSRPTRSSDYRLETRHGVQFFPTIEIFAELISGGLDTGNALTIAEASRFLRKTPPYGRTVLQRMHLRIFGTELGKDSAE